MVSQSKSSTANSGLCMSVCLSVHHPNLHTEGEGAHSRGRLQQVTPIPDSAWEISAVEVDGRDGGAVDVDEAPTHRQLSHLAMGPLYLSDTEIKGPKDKGISDAPGRPQEQCCHQVHQGNFLHLPPQAILLGEDRGHTT